MKKLLFILCIGFLLFASCQNEVSSDANQTDTTPPFPVKKLTAEEGDKYISLSWINPADSDFYGTKITFTPSARNVSQPVIIEGTPSGKSTTTFNGLVNNTEYTFSLIALDKMQNKSEIVTIRATPRSDTTPPSSVTNITATPGDKSVTLSWTNPNDSDFVCTRITFTKASNQVTNPITVQGEPGKNSTTTIVGLENGTEYTFSLTALDEKQNESIPISIKATPKSQVIYSVEVEDFTVTPRDSSVILSWTNPSDIDFYGIEITVNDTKTTLDATPSEKQSYTVSNLINNNEYTFTIKTIDKSNNESNGITKNCTPREGYLSLSIKLPNDTIYTDDLGNEKRNIILTTDKASITITVSSSSSVTNAVWKKSDDTSISTAEELLSDETANTLSFESDSTNLEVTENGYYYIAVKNEDGKTAYSYAVVNTLDKTPLDEISHFVATSDGKTIECSWEDAHPQIEYDSPLKELLISYIYDDNISAPESGEITIDAGVEKASIKIADGKNEADNLQITIKTVDKLGHISQGFSFKSPCCKYIAVTDDDIVNVIENLTEDNRILYISNTKSLSTLAYALNNLYKKSPDVRLQLDLSNLLNLTTVSGLSNKTNLSSITLSNNTTSISYRAFENCTSLSNIKLSENLEEIQDFAFENCTNLSSIIIPESVKCVDKNAFYNCVSLKKITIGPGTSSFGLPTTSDITRIPDYEIYFTGTVEQWWNIEKKNTSVLHPYDLFINDTLLTEPIFDKKTKTIPNNAFNCCKSLKKISIPDTITSIGENAFHYCSELAEVNLPHSIKRIENNTFYGCSKLQSITILETVTYIGQSAFRGCKELSKVIFSDKCTTVIEPGAFSGCDILELTIPGDLLKINTNAFDNTIKKITYSKCIYPAFSNVEEIYLKDNVTYIPPLKLNFLKKITIPASVTRIDINAFYNCIRLETIEYTGTIEQLCQNISIDYYETTESEQDRFYWHGKNSRAKVFVNGTELLRDIELPEGITRINDYIFYNLISSIKLPSTLKSIGKHAFHDCGLKEIIIPDNVISIGDYAFCGCNNLDKITLGKKLKILGNMVFYNSRIRGTITIPASVTKIGGFSFENKYIVFDDKSTHWYNLNTGESLGKNPSKGQLYSSYPETTIISEKYTEE